MPHSTNSADLAQFTHAADLMHGAIPDFTRFIASLKNLLQDCSSVCGSTKIKAEVGFPRKALERLPPKRAFKMLKKITSQRVLCGQLDTKKLIAFFLMHLIHNEPVYLLRFQKIN